MNKITDMELFSLLADTSPVTNSQMENAYECFTEYMKAVSQSGNNYSEVFRMLNTTRVELAFLQSLYRHGEGEKCPEINLPSKSGGFCQFRTGITIP